MGLLGVMLSLGVVARDVEPPEEVALPYPKAEGSERRPLGVPRAVMLPLGGVPRAVMLPLRGECAPGESDEAPKCSSFRCSLQSCRH